MYEEKLKNLLERKEMIDESIYKNDLSLQSCRNKVKHYTEIVKGLKKELKEISKDISIINKNNELLEKQKLRSVENIEKFNVPIVEIKLNIPIIEKCCGSGFPITTNCINIIKDICTYEEQLIIMLISAGHSEKFVANIVGRKTIDIVNNTRKKLNFIIWKNCEKKDEKCQ